MSAEAREAFGDEARRIALAYPDDLAAIFADGSDPARAQLAASARRRACRPFFVMPVVDEPRALLAMQIAPALLEQYVSVDDRRSVFDGLAAQTLAINGQPMHQATVYDPARMKALRDFMIFGDALLVRSEAELLRIRRLFGRTRPLTAIAPISDPSVPSVTRSEHADAIVVWAPRLPARALAVIAFALASFRAPVAIVCAGGALPGGLAAAVVTPEDARAWLARACVIVDAHTADPGPALGLAATGSALVVTSTSGAAEFLRGAFSYDPWDWRSVLRAVSAARGSEGPQLRRPVLDRADLDATLAASVPRIATDPPLVSIVTPTYNRRMHLPKCLEGIERQSYPNVEALVVNDAGEPVDDIIARYPRARLINLEENVRVVRAVNAGLTQARGEYIGLLADDDVMYPDHVARLVAALQRGSAKVAHGNIIMNLQRPSGDGYATYGFLGNFDGHLDTTEILYTSAISAQGFLMHRSVIEEAGPLDASLRCTSDYELTLRLSRSYDFVHVDYITGEMTYRNDGTNESAFAGRDLTDEFALLFQRYPSEGSALVESGRAGTIGYFKSREGSGSFYEPAVPLPD